MQYLYSTYRLFVRSLSEAPRNVVAQVFHKHESRVEGQQAVRLARMDGKIYVLKGTFLSYSKVQDANFMKLEQTFTVSDGFGAKIMEIRLNSMKRSYS